MHVHVLQWVFGKICSFLFWQLAAVWWTFLEDVAHVLGNLYQFMGNHGQHVTWSWKWTLILIFGMLASVPRTCSHMYFYQLRGLTSMLPHTSSKTAAFVWRQCRGLLNMRMHVQSFSLLLWLEESRILATNWIHWNLYISGVGECWRFCLLHRGPEGGTVTRYGYCSTCHIPRLPWCFPKVWDEMMKGNMSEPWRNLMNDCMTIAIRIGLPSINWT